VGVILRSATTLSLPNTCQSAFGEAIRAQQIDVYERRASVLLKEASPTYFQHGMRVRLTGRDALGSHADHFL